MKKRVISVLCAVLALSFMYTSVFAGVSEFKKIECYLKYDIAAMISEGYWSTMGESFKDEVGKTIDGTVVGANDYVILKEALDKTYSNKWDTPITRYQKFGNGLKNVYVWQEKADGTFKKLYGGISEGPFKGFESYALPAPSAAVGSANVNTMPGVFATQRKMTGSLTDGTFGIQSGTSDCTVSFCRPGVNMNGVGEVTLGFAQSGGDYRAIPTFSLCIAQGENAAKEAEPTDGSFKQFEIFKAEYAGAISKGDNSFEDGVGRVRLYRNGNAVKNTDGSDFEFHTYSYFNADKYAAAVVTVDTVSAEPRAKVKVSDKDGNAYKSEWISLADTGFDFTQDMTVKLLVHDKTGKSGTVLQLGDFYYKKTVDVTDTECKAEVAVKNVGFDDLNGVVIGALYDADSNMLISMNTADYVSSGGESTTQNFTFSKTADTKNCKVKFLFWENLDGSVKPLGAQDLSAATPTIICGIEE